MRGGTRGQHPETKKPKNGPTSFPRGHNYRKHTKTLAKQNPELDIKEGDIRAKFSYTSKRKTNNLVIEVDSRTQKKLILTRIKLGWTICRAEDYIVAKRCFSCSRFNHNFRDCRGEETCPLYTGSHKLKDCTATKSEYKCINSLTYNRHHQTRSEERRVGKV